MTMDKGIRIPVSKIYLNEFSSNNLTNFNNDQDINIVKDEFLLLYDQYVSLWESDDLLIKIGREYFLVPRNVQPKYLSPYDVRPLQFKDIKLLVDKTDQLKFIFPKMVGENCRFSLYKLYDIIGDELLDEVNNIFILNISYSTYNKFFKSNRKLFFDYFIILEKSVDHHWRTLKDPEYYILTDSYELLEISEKFMYLLHHNKLTPKIVHKYFRTFLTNRSKVSKLDYTLMEVCFKE